MNAIYYLYAMLFYSNVLNSSIFRAILRLCEVDSGRILIDGVDVSMVGLDALRSSISIIPQDPMLFSGTIRSVTGSR